MAKILVVDDDQLAAKMLYFLLNSEAHKVEVAFNLTDALSKMVLFEPNLILLDVRLGKEDGRDLCKKIRAFGKKVPIILLSAHAHLLTRYKESGADDCLEKSFDLTTLLAKINKLLAV